MRYLELPAMNWASFTPYMMFSIFGHWPIQNSFALPLFAINAEIADTYETTSMLFRVGNTLPGLIAPNLLKFLLTDENFPPILHGDILR